MSALPDGAGPVLVNLARSAIAADLGLDPPPPVAVKDDRWLDEPGASFVTLRLDTALRGCIGSLQAYRPLRKDVAGNAHAAAFQDPRFPDLSRGEYADVSIEVSVLTAPEPLAFWSREEALAKLVPGRDGVVLTAAGRRATFLPQVWEELPEPEDFLRHLMLKAGLVADHWDDSVRLDTYRVTAFEEPQAR